MVKIVVYLPVSDDLHPSKKNKTKPKKEDTSLAKSLFAAIINLRVLDG